MNLPYTNSNTQSHILFQRICDSQNTLLILKLRLSPKMKCCAIQNSQKDFLEEAKAVFTRSHFKVIASEEM